LRPRCQELRFRLLLPCENLPRHFQLFQRQPREHDIRHARLDRCGRQHFLSGRQLLRPRQEAERLHLRPELHLHRLRETLQQERTRLTNRLHGLLATHGVELPVRADFLARLAGARRWDGSRLPPGVAQRLTFAWEQRAFLTAQLAAVDAARAALAVDPATETGRWVDRLQTLRGIGSIGAWSLVTEMFGWRQIRNGRELGAFVGLVPAPYQSGQTAHDQGITRAGNRHVRRMVVQLAWSWLRYQPLSALSRWYRERFGRGRRLRRIGIVALARKLLIAWWRYGTTGVIPEGALVKA
jgi:transposase